MAGGAAVEFDSFVAGRSRALLRTAYLLTQDEGLAEDLLQTALTKAWFAWKRIDGDPEPYVRRILVTTSASWWRRRWWTELPSATIEESDSADDTESLGDRHDLWLALSRLPARQRAVIVLRFLEDRSEAETAALTGSSVGTVKSQCAKALAKLRIDTALESTTEQENGRWVR